MNTLVEKIAERTSDPDLKVSLFKAKLSRIKHNYANWLRGELIGAILLEQFIAQEDTAGLAWLNANPKEEKPPTRKRKK